MNIIELAKQAGWIEEAGEPEFGCFNLEAFANLVAAAARADEREECAKLCEPQEEHDDPLTAWKIAKAIRERGDT